MTVLSVTSRVVLLFLAVTVSGCSAFGEEDYYGYEDSFVLPEPDMVLVTPDDKPGRTIDEMLGVGSQAVVIKKEAETESVEQEPTYEHGGRFGSKEKISLRKGLNAPDVKIVYGSKKREEIKVVRALELKEATKDPLLEKSEKEMLAEIIAPKTTEVEVVEVVAAAEKEPSPSAAPVVVEVVPAKKLVPAQKIDSQEEENGQKLIPLVTEPVKTRKEEKIVLKPLPAASEKQIVLMPPDEKGKVVLTAPETGLSQDDPSIDIFIEE